MIPPGPARGKSAPPTRVRVGPTLLSGLNYAGVYRPGGAAAAGEGRSRWGREEEACGAHDLISPGRSRVGRSTSTTLEDGRLLWLHRA